MVVRLWEPQNYSYGNIEIKRLENPFVKAMYTSITKNGLIGHPFK